MAENKTKETKESVVKFLNAIKDEKRREDCFKVLEVIKKVTKLEPKMWGPSIVGFGSYHYKYESGREGDMLITGFSPRKQNLTIYIMPGFEKYDDLIKKLGKHKTGKSCLYINRLDDVKIDVLKNLISESFQYMKRKYG